MRLDEGFIEELEEAHIDIREPDLHECGELCSVAKFNKQTATYFIGCYHWPKCQYTRRPFYPEDEIKVSRLEAIHRVTGEK